jgi:SlyX protein
MRIITTRAIQGTETVRYAPRRWYPVCAASLGCARVRYPFEQATMVDNDLEKRFETLEIRLAHQEAAIDELTRALLDQAQKLGEQALTIERLQQQVRSLAASPLAPPEDETPPPHY